MDNILGDIKKLLGINFEDATFDTDIAIHLNTGFMVLNQVGLGPLAPFVILTGEELWSEFDPTTNFEGCKSWLYLYVKKIFDNPGTSFVNDSDKEVLNELIWRLQIQQENQEVTDGR